MNMTSILENYSYSKRISELEVEYLEKCWLDSLNSHHYNRFPSFAPAIVCDEANVKRGSYWVVCNAAILDLLRPLENEISRFDRITNILVTSGLNQSAA